MSFYVLIHGLGMGAGGPGPTVTGNPRLSNESATASADAVVALLADGYLRIYDGTQPNWPDDAVTTQTLLAELRLGNPAFGAAVDGVAMANVIAGEDSAIGGTPTWYRALKSDGTSPVQDGSVGTSGTTLVLDMATIPSGATVDVGSWEYTQPKVDSTP